MASFSFRLDLRCTYKARDAFLLVDALLLNAFSSGVYSARRYRYNSVMALADANILFYMADNTNNYEIK